MFEVFSYTSNVTELSKFNMKFEIFFVKLNLDFYSESPCVE